MDYRTNNIRQMPGMDKSVNKSKTSAPRRRKKVWDRLFTLGTGLDMQLLVLVLFLLGIGLATLFSASYTYGYYYEGDSLFYIKKQLGFAFLGVVAMLAISTFNYRIFSKWLVWPIYGFCILLLLVVLLFKGTSLVPEINGAHRWISLGSVQFQASEVAKFGVVVILAHILAKQPSAANYHKAVTIPVLLVLASILALIVAEKHISATLIICIISGIVLIVGGFSLKLILGGVAAIGAVGAYLLIFTDKFAYALRRVQGWLSPFDPPEGVDTYQTVQSLYAIGSGGFTGQGIGNSRQKHLFLPEPQNDFVFSVFCEELGFVGAIIVIILFIWLVFRGMEISIHARDRFGTLLGLGITFTIGIQAALNICVVTGIIPNTGISLPFFSYGGTSLLMLLGEMGVLLSISRNNFNDTSSIPALDAEESDS